MGRERKCEGMGQDAWEGNNKETVHFAIARISSRVHTWDSGLQWHRETGDKKGAVEIRLPCQGDVATKGLDGPSNLRRLGT